ncbi:ABC transporter substrate-binding protein [Chitinophaga sp. GCM10012297]|uniref:Amino acid ABC transporter substrate-binding protein n=1 Tax=Chitinophaga chungangae TaxID=2821488 RepID=A0ABS3YKX2_9BACT|nr:ABC transporter substrate-binding protein [Chitinophaga chungangae]MBO9154913.1 amino acid ABC transporter substrate-binding protein [Chitinophaga chungangae]
MNLSRTSGSLAMTVAVILMMQACSIFRPTVTKTDGPPPELSKPKPAEKEPEVKKPEPKAAPFNVPAFAKEVKRDNYTVAVFAPFFLDSVFATSTDIPGRTMPRYVMPGLEFYEGVQLALDSLKSHGVKLTVQVFDNKAKNNDVAAVLRNRQIDNADLIIGAVGTPEFRLLSDFAKQKEINFVSATYPNDGGVTENPFLLISNSTLRSHVEAMHDYAQKGFANKNIVILRRNTNFEAGIAANIKAAYDRLNYDKKARVRELVWSDATTEGQLSQLLLTDRPNILIITALDEVGAKSILRKLAPQKATYPMHVFGMPTWDIMKFKEPEFAGITMYYSSPYYNDKTDVYSKYVTDQFRKIYKARPSDMAFKGFELTWYFVNLLSQDGLYFNKDMNKPGNRVFTTFNFQPVYLKDGEETPDYFENKNIYIIQKGDSADFRMNSAL